MTQALTVSGSTYNTPVNLESPGWGEELKDWHKAVTDLLATLSGTYDISDTTASLTNNQSSAADITGLSFSSTVSRSFVVDYVVYRDGTSDVYESGKINGVYNGSAWEYTIEKTGDASVDFQVTAAGQVQYFTSDLTGHSSSTIKFRGRTIDV